MMKYASLVFVILLLLLPACTKSTAGTQGKVEDKTPVRADDPANLVTDENAARPVVVLRNPKSMSVETKARSAAAVKQETELAKSCGQQFLEYAARNGVSAANAELTKARSGAFAAHLPKTYFYGVMFERNGDVLKIVAHTTSTDYLGLEVDMNKWKDLTEWLYLKAAAGIFDAGKSNQVVLENVYWKDPAWSSNKPARFEAYERIYNIEDKTYWLHYTTWVDE